ncbi:hypothetical protein J2046_006799 [Rhizobium petrolearium]|nr:hypothetical protein [Neorhizobium petrolearium]
MPGLDLIAIVVSSLATTVAGANILYLGTYALPCGDSAQWKVSR